MLRLNQIFIDSKKDEFKVVEVAQDGKSFKTQQIIRIKSDDGRNFRKSLAPNIRSHSFSEIGSSLFEEQTTDFHKATNTARKNVTLNEVVEIQSFFQNNITDKDRPFDLDKEQANAINIHAQNVLVSARAGSGKTRILVAKIVHIIEKCDISPGNILVLAFNKNVPEEISRRLRDDIKSKRDSHAFQGVEIKTFHQMAKKWADYNGKILDNERSRFIKLIIEDLKETQPEFKERVYRFFRAESLQVDKRSFQSTENYYSCIRNLQYQTLKGENVKSVGEKWIADYLYEHGIDYYYEHEFYPNSITTDTFKGTPDQKKRCLAFLKENIDDYQRIKTVKPDFFLKVDNIVWEHWGINEKDLSSESKESFQEAFDMTWNQYKKLMEWKRTFWKFSWRKRLNPDLSKDPNQISKIVRIKKLIETSVADMPNVKEGRTIFEQRLEALLKQEGVSIQERDKTELINEVWDKAVDRFTEMMGSFISKYQQNYFDKPYSNFEEQIESYGEEERTYAFLKLGMNVLKKYEKVLKATSKPARFKEFVQDKIDFNQLLANAIKCIEAGDADQDIKQLQYILIDEYQDFSGLFHKFIVSIRKRNPNIKLFCVGDTWQAINRFMGANTSYFNEFEDYFPASKGAAIRTNYRSAAQIVLTSNEFMEVCGFKEKPAKPDPNNQKEGSVHCLNINDPNCVWLEYRGEKKDSIEYIVDSKYIAMWTHENKENSYSDYIAAKYFKKCVEIIDSIKNRGEELSVYILHRNNRFRGIHELERFEKKLHKYLKDQLSYTRKECDAIIVGTMHRSKGLEASHVIILEANRGIIPSIHPDNTLYWIFGEKPEVVVEDEMRLFYVALTRAKQSLHILYEDDKVSEFVVKLMEGKTLPQHSITKQKDPFPYYPNEADEDFFPW